MAGVWSHSFCPPAARNTSPVERWHAWSRRCSRSACVPLPTPGAPRRTIRHGIWSFPCDSLHGAEGPCSHADRSCFSEAMCPNVRALWPRCCDSNHIALPQSTAFQQHPRRIAPHGPVVPLSAPTRAIVITSVTMQSICVQRAPQVSQQCWNSTPER